MLLFLPFDHSHRPSKGIPARPLSQDAKLKPQTVGIGLITLLTAGFTLYMSCLNLLPPHGLAPTLETTAQSPTRTTTTPLTSQHPETCQPHEVFRLSDRRCYELQGE